MCFMGLLKDLSLCMEEMKFIGKLCELMQKHLKLMNSKELNLAKKIKKLMFSFQGIMVFYKMPAAILFITLLFSILKLGLFLPF